MKTSVLPFNRYYLFISLSFSIVLSIFFLSGCGGGSYSGTANTTNTYIAGSSCFDNAIDSSGNIWVANGGTTAAIVGTAPGDSNVMKFSPSGKVIGTYVAGTFPIGIAIDKSGNVWVENYGNGTPGTAPGDSNVTELSSTGALIGTYVAGSFPAGGIAIDASGNVWITNWGAASGKAGNPGTGLLDSNVTELSPTGALIGTYVAGSSPGGIAIDSSGNIWVANKGNGTPGTGLLDSNVTELSSTGITIGTFIAGSHPEGLAIDPSGNVWVVNKGNGTIGTGQLDSNITELSSAGTLIGTYIVGNYPEIVAIDSAGNVWVANGYNRGMGGTGPAESSITELNPSGSIINTYTTGNQPYGIAIDKSGNVWITNFGNGYPGTDISDSNIQEYVNAAKGPQYFPYSGPQWPGAE